MKLSELEFDKNIYPRNRFDNECIKKYIDAIRLGAKFPPIIVGIYKGRNLIVDGYHRFIAYQRLQKTHIDCIVKEFETEKDLYIEAIKNNIVHGKPFEQYEKENIILKLKKINLSPIEIANIVFIPQSTVIKIIRINTPKNIDKINEKIRKDIVRERIDFNLNYKEQILLLRWNGFLSDIKKIRENKIKINAEGKIVLLEILKEIKIICE
jgi:hypothetical protein